MDKEERMVCDEWSIWRELEWKFYVYRYRGNTVINFVIVNENVYNKTLDFKILERVDSDCLPLQLRIRKIKEENEENLNLKA